MFYVNCFDKTVLYMCTEYHLEVNTCQVSTWGVNEHMINVHYYYILRRDVNPSQLGVDSGLLVHT